MELAQLRASGFSNQVFSLVIIPTRSCQLACTYCYEEGLAAIVPVKDLFERILNLVKRRSDGSTQFHFNWFGGEPTLSNSQILEFLQNVRDLGLDFKSSMTTNFYGVTREVFSQLVVSGVTAYQVSIDGNQSYHDSKRIHRSGSGTWNKVVRNLVQIKTLDLDYKILIRVHYHGNNEQEIYDFIESAGSEFSSDYRFTFYLRKIVGPEYKADGLAWEEAKQRIESRMQSLGLRVKSDESICYASKANSLVIDADGTVRKCTHYLGDDVINHVGHLSPDGQVQINQAKLWKFCKFLYDGEIEKAKCPYRVIRNHSDGAFIQELT